ncbi:MAG: hypothetical protein KGJ13_06600 [Patescibacteria group bacterium]|nr:hypothetical protein [Patescibacteria group bacterium]
MNAIEMAVKAAMEKMVGTLADRVPDLLQNLPPEVLGQIGQISQIALSLRALLDRIEYQNRLIMAHLNIPADVEPAKPAKEIDHVRSE